MEPHVSQEPLAEGEGPELSLLAAQLPCHSRAYLRRGTRSSLRGLRKPQAGYP